MNNPSNFPPVSNAEPSEALAQSPHGASASAAAAPAMSQPTSPGAMLRQARESQNISLQELSQSLNVPTAKLQALENDEWQRLPGTVFVRTVTASVCRQLKVDATPILALLPASTAPSLERRTTQPRVGATGQPFQSCALPEEGAPSSATRMLWVISVLLLLAAGLAAALFWLPGPWSQWLPALRDMPALAAPSAQPNSATLTTPAAPVVAQPESTSAAVDVTSTPEAANAQTTNTEAAPSVEALSAPAADATSVPASTSAADMQPPATTGITVVTVPVQPQVMPAPATATTPAAR